MHSSETLTEVQDFSYRYLWKPEIALITGVSIEDLNNPEHPIGQAFLKGRYIRKAEFNNSLIQLSKQLSSPAMAIEFKVSENAFINDHKNS